MGEVYRARDTKLARDVAIKVLPADVASDPDRLARFQREARVLASLNHPHIGAIHGFEESSGITALVLELVEGPTLAERIERGPVSTGDALKIARQIAEALDVAHEKGIIHRDLKPANIKLTADGQVKVLDFGLAKFAHSSNQSSAQATESLATREGAIFGTPAYMSPEQARGLPVDKRTDIWAFGCVLYEMLTRRPAFAGNTVSDTLVAVLDREPNWSAIPSSTPAWFRSLLRRCLEKDPSRRVRDIGDARLELDEGPALESVPPEARRPFSIVALGASIVTGGLAASMIWLFATRPQSTATVEAPFVTRVLRLTSGPAHESGAAISPDGKWVAYLSNARGPTDIWVKFIAGGDPVNLTGSTGLEVQSQSDIGGLAISPDGATIAFDARVRDVEPTSFATWVVPAPLGGVPRRFLTGGNRAVRWSRDGTRLVYVEAGSSAGDALWVADADGGNPKEIAPRRGGMHKHWPTWSADGRHVYLNYSISTSNAEPTGDLPCAFGRGADRSGRDVGAPGGVSNCAARWTRPALRRQPGRRRARVVVEAPRPTRCSAATTHHWDRRVRGFERVGRRS